jgi:hypothetical protein
MDFIDDRDGNHVEKLGDIFLVEIGIIIFPDFPSKLEKLWSPSMPNIANIRNHVKKVETYRFGRTQSDKSAEASIFNSSKYTQKPHSLFSDFCNFQI